MKFYYFKRLVEEEQELLLQEEIGNITGRPHYQRPHPHEHMTNRPYSGQTSRQYAWY